MFANVGRLLFRAASLAWFRDFLMLVCVIVVLVGHMAARQAAVRMTSTRRVFAVRAASHQGMQQDGCRGQDVYEKGHVA